MKTIIARVTGTGTGSQPGEMTFIVDYTISDNSLPSGNVAINVDQSLTDQEMESLLRHGVAQHVNDAHPGESFVESDVRGCRI